MNHTVLLKLSLKIPSSILAIVVFQMNKDGVRVNTPCCSKGSGILDVNMSLDVANVRCCV